MREEVAEEVPMLQKKERKRFIVKEGTVKERVVVSITFTDIAKV